MVNVNACARRGRFHKIAMTRWILILLLAVGSLSSGWAQEEKSGPKIEQKKKEAPTRSDVRGLSPEERDAKRKEMRERMQKQLAELRKKKADGTLSEAEKKRLERMEEVNKRFEQAGARASSTNRVGNGKSPSAR
jgi:hypothetical protein